MRSVVKLEIAAPPAKVAELFSDPTNDPKWMTDLERYEPISGRQGARGSRYRLVAKKMEFVATVLARDLPRAVDLELDADYVTVTVSARFQPLPSGHTRLVSTEVFRFKGVKGKLAGLFARHGIDSAHRKQMDAFRRFAEANQAR